jgi:hypothetical protein
VRILLNHLNEAILREIAQTATKIADRGTARGDFLVESKEYVDADTLTMVLHELREKLGDMDEHRRIEEGG